ncbi:MAG: L,D-transpeptidase Cds6 family protein, partial [Burkholderiales bacterium]
YSAMATQAYNRALARDEKRAAPVPRLSLLDSMQMPAVAQLAPPPPLEAPAPTVSTAPRPEPKPAPAAAAAEPAKPPTVAPPPKTPSSVAPAPPALAANKLESPKDAKVTPSPAPKPTAAATPPSTPAAPAAAPTAPATPATSTPIAKAKTEPTPAVTPAASGLEQQARAVTEAVQGWAKSWSAQNADAYLAAYATNFQPEGGVSRAEWSKVRRDRITRPKRVEVKLIDMQIKLLTDTTARARFLQFYSSEIMEDTVEKRLELVREGAGWKILREQVGQRQN